MRGRLLAVVLVCALAAPVALAAGRKPTEAWRGSFNPAYASITVLRFAHGKIEARFSATCAATPCRRQ